MGVQGYHIRPNVCNQTQGFALAQPKNPKREQPNIRRVVVALMQGRPMRVTKQAQSLHAVAMAHLGQVPEVPKMVRATKHTLVEGFS